MQEIFDLHVAWLVVTGLLFASGLWLLIGGLARLLRGKVLRGPLRAAIGAVIGALAIALAAVGLNVHTYQRLNYEQPVAWLEFQQTGPQAFEALLMTPDGADRAFRIHGDEWQLDARVLKWQGIGAMLGLDPRYRLERLSGRYVNIGDERHAARSVYPLNDGERGIDVWRVSREHEDVLPFVDTVYGSAAYMPMIDGARFEVVITEDALVARRLQSTMKSQ